MDLQSRAFVGRSLGFRTQTDLVLVAMTMTVWRRRPKGSLISHSDQESQFGRHECNRWCKDNRLSPIRSRRREMLDNAAPDSFFSRLKGEQIKKRL